MSSDPRQRFLDSTKLDYEKWHDGTGYDLDAFDEMSPDDREDVLCRHAARGADDWRDVELFAHVADEPSRAALRRLIESTDTRVRLRAAKALESLGEPVGFEHLLAAALRGLNANSEGAMTTALMLAEEHRGPAILEALLWGARNRPEVAVHYAAMAAYHAGAAGEPFDWNLRPLFLRFGEGESPSTREQAFNELCDLIGVDPATIPTSFA